MSLTAYVFVNRERLPYVVHSMGAGEQCNLDDARAQGDETVEKCKLNDVFVDAQNHSLLYRFCQHKCCFGEDE